MKVSTSTISKVTTKGPLCRTNTILYTLCFDSKRLSKASETNISRHILKQGVSIEKYLHSLHKNY